MTDTQKGIISRLEITSILPKHCAGGRQGHTNTLPELSRSSIALKASRKLKNGSTMPTFGRICPLRINRLAGAPASTADERLSQETNQTTPIMSQHAEVLFASLTYQDNTFVSELQGVSAVWPTRKRESFPGLE